MTHPLAINALLFADDVAIFGTAEEVTTHATEAQNNTPIDWDTDGAQANVP